MQSPTANGRSVANSSSDESDVDDTGPLSIDETFEILKNNRRRLVLEYLHENEETVKLNTLADRVTATENDTDVSSITSAERKRVYVGLYQFHLPKMADMGVIDYDQDRGDVALTERGRQLYREHDDRETPDRQWHLAYLGVAGGGLLAVAASLWFYTAPFAIALLALESLLVGAIATAQASAERSEPGE